MDDPRVSEEIKIGNSHAESRNRHDQETVEAPEDDDDLGTHYFENGSNPFRDDNIPDPDLHLAKSDMAIWIRRVLDEQGLSTREAEAKTGIAHSEFSRIRNSKLTRFTLDRLFVIYHRLEPGKEVVLQRKEPVPGVWKRWDERNREEG